MKKFVSYLALSAFMVASHMSVVHAWDMFGMGMNHEMGMKHSIFCNENPADKSASDCAKETVPEKTALTARSVELPDFEAKKVPHLAFAEAEVSERIQNVENRSIPPPPGTLPSRSELGGYSAHVGADVKKLD